MKRNELTVYVNNMDESYGHNMKWNMQGVKRYILYYSIYMKCIKQTNL